MELGAMPLGKEILPECFVETEALSKNLLNFNLIPKADKKSEAFNFNLLTEIKKVNSTKHRANKVEYFTVQ